MCIHCYFFMRFLEEMQRMLAAHRYLSKIFCSLYLSHLPRQEGRIFLAYQTIVATFSPENAVQIMKNSFYSPTFAIVAHQKIDLGII